MRVELEREMLEATLGDEKDRILSPRDLLGMIRQRLWVVALSAIVLTGVTLGYSLMQTPLYEASSRVLLVVQKDTPGQPEQVEEAPSSLQSDAQTIELYAETMAQALPNLSLAEQVVEQQDLEMSPSDLLSNLRVESLPETSLIEIGFTGSDPEVAREVANAVADAASQETLPVDQLGLNSVTAMVWERAETPASPVEPQPARNALIGLAVGIILGVGLALLLEYLDDRLRSPDEAEHLSGLPAVGVIPDHVAPKDKQRKAWFSLFRAHKESDEVPRFNGAGELLITTADPTATATEAYRALRTVLLRAFTDASSKVVVLTGAGGDGCQTATCANLGVVLSQVDGKTIILDCDFRNPTMGRLFGFHDVPGVADVLAADHGLPEVWKEPLPNLKIVPAGSMPYDPADLLGSERFSQFLTDLRNTFDYVLIDAPDVGVIPDAVVLSAQSDGVLLAVQTHETPKDTLRRAVYSLRAFGTNIFGLVVSSAKVSGEYSRKA